MTANMYKIGDYVYFEISSTAPYQIRRIEELNKTQTGNVEAKVLCFYRRRDISPSLLKLADKHQSHSSQVKASRTCDACQSQCTVETGGTETDEDIKPPAEPHWRCISKDCKKWYLKEKTVEEGVGRTKVEVKEESPMEVEIEMDGEVEGTKEKNEEEKPQEQVVEEKKEEDVEAKNDVGAKKEEEVEAKAEPVVDATEDAAQMDGVVEATEDETTVESIDDATEDAPELGPTIPLPGMEELDDSGRHKLRHRELFLSRQIETLPATHIRGKCTVTLLNELETPDNYMDKDDAFFYTLVYDPQQKSLTADKGEIRVGSKYQAEVPERLSDDDRKTYRENCNLETTVFHPNHSLTDRQIDQFIVISRSVGTFSRALDTSSASKQPNLQMSAAAASRDVTLFHVLSLLHQADYDLGKAVTFLVPPPDKSAYPLEVDKATGHRTSMLGGPLLCRDQLEEWSAAEAVLFEEALEKYGKDFNDIRHDFLPWKSLRDIVEYYYMWKTTDRYIHQKRFKAAEAESRLKQVYIPVYNKPNPASVTKNTGDAHTCGQSTCESCEGCKSVQWFSWGPHNMELRLCDECWKYWKRFGGLKQKHKYENHRAVRDAAGTEGTELRCPECKKPFDSAERLLAHRDSVHPPIRCPIESCRREVRGQAHLQRHLQADHNLPLPDDMAVTPKVPRPPFCFSSSLSDRVARRLAPRSVLYMRRAARCPFQPVADERVRSHLRSLPKPELATVATQICSARRDLIANSSAATNGEVTVGESRKRPAMAENGHEPAPKKAVEVI